jgi:DNA-binding transcriptional MerR regulator/methylmalonyl-CoA mutase cobalamin-binding subunit
MAASPAPTATAVFPIRTVAAVTGINPITLRAWERRYGLVKPQRTASGRRMYTQADIDTVHRALALVQRGVAIGQARDALTGTKPARTASRSSTLWVRQRARMLAAIEQFDEAALDQVYDELLALHPIERVTCEALLPLLIELGQRWRGRVGGIAEEHFFSVYLRNKLGARFHHRRGAASDGPKLIVACLPGEHHEAGAFLFALAAHERGYRVVLLGADMPLSELAYVARRTNASALVLSGTHEVPSQVAGAQMAQLVAASKVPVFVGGTVAVHQRNRLVAAGALPLGTDIEAALSRLGQSVRAN